MDPGSPAKTRSLARQLTVLRSVAGDQPLGGGSRNQIRHSDGPSGATSATSRDATRRRTTVARPGPRLHHPDRDSAGREQGPADLPRGRVPRRPAVATVPPSAALCRDNAARGRRGSLHREPRPGPCVDHHHGRRLRPRNPGYAATLGRADGRGDGSSSGTAGGTSPREEPSRTTQEGSITHEMVGEPGGT